MCPRDRKAAFYFDHCNALHMLLTQHVFGRHVYIVQATPHAGCMDIMKHLLHASVHA